MPQINLESLFPFGVIKAFGVVKLKEKLFVYSNNDFSSLETYENISSSKSLKYSDALNISSLWIGFTFETKLKY